MTQALARDAVMRVALNLSNSRLVSGKGVNGDWIGVAPDLARELARQLDVSLEFITYKSPRRGCRRGWLEGLDTRDDRGRPGTCKKHQLH